MFTKNIKVKNFFNKKEISTKSKIRELLRNLVSSDNQILLSMSKNYKDSYKKKINPRFKEDR